MIRRVRLTRSTTALAATALIAVGLTTGCAPTAPRATDHAHVVVTTNILGDIVSQVLTNQAEITVLMRPNADPHSFEISAQEASLLSEADLIVSSGLGLEEGLQQHLDRAAASGTPLFVAGDAIHALPYADSDAAGTPDPHFWTDPTAVIDVVTAFEERAAALPGVEENTLRTDAAAYRAELSALDHDMRDSFAAIPAQHRALVTNHHVFGYLARRYGFTIIGAAVPGGTALAAPSAADLHELSDAIVRSGVPAIFAESSQPDRLMQVLASETGIEVRVIELFTESLSPAGDGAESYLAMMRANAERIAAGLSTTHSSR